MLAEKRQKFLACREAAHSVQLAEFLYHAVNIFFFRRYLLRINVNIQLQVATGIAFSDYGIPTLGIGLTLSFCLGRTAGAAVAVAVAVAVAIAVTAVVAGDEDLQRS